MRARIKKTRPALSKGLMRLDIENNKKKEIKSYPYSSTIWNYRKSNTNTSVQCAEMVKISKTELQTSNIKKIEKCKIKIIKNPRERELFTS